MAKAGAPEPQAVCDIVLPASAGVPAVIRLSVGGVPALYLAAEMPAESDTGARLFELVGYRPAEAGTETAVRRYSVLVERPGNSRTAVGSCDCPAGTYHADKHGPCRHLRLLHALWQRGKL